MFFLKSIQNAMCIYIGKIEIKCNLKLSLNNQTFEGKVSAICPSLFFIKQKIVSPLLQFRYGLKHGGFFKKTLKNTDIL